MIKRIPIVVFILLIISSNVYSDFYSYTPKRESNSVIAAVQIKDQGIYNLVISVSFLQKPKDKKIYKSDEYEKLINTLRVEWQGIALKKVLERNVLKITELVDLRNDINSEIVVLIETLKKEFINQQHTKVVFAISDFFLLKPKSD